MVPEATLCVSGTVANEAIHPFPRCFLENNQCIHTNEIPITQEFSVFYVYTHGVKVCIWGIFRGCMYLNHPMKNGSGVDDDR